MTYLVIKWLHVLSSTILFGTGIGSAFYMLTTSLGNDTRTVAVLCEPMDLQIPLLLGQRVTAFLGEPRRTNR